jgi:hypothetical protein
MQKELRIVSNDELMSGDVHLCVYLSTVASTSHDRVSTMNADPYIMSVIISRSCMKVKLLELLHLILLHDVLVVRRRKFSISVSLKIEDELA